MGILAGTPPENNKKIEPNLIIQSGRDTNIADYIFNNVAEGLSKGMTHFEQMLLKESEKKLPPEVLLDSRIKALEEATDIQAKHIASVESELLQYFDAQAAIAKSIWRWVPFMKQRYSKLSELIVLANGALSHLQVSQDDLQEHLLELQIEKSALDAHNMDTPTEH